MTFRLGILGGGLQGTEASVLARWSGWETVLVDHRPDPPARNLASRFVQLAIEKATDLDRALVGCDFIIPACEDLPTLELLSRWSQSGYGPPTAFDLAAYGISSDKAKSKDLFKLAGAPTPGPYPQAGFPLIAKPVSGSGSRGVRLLESPDDFRQMFPGGDWKGWVVEEYCPGPSYSLEVTGRPGHYQAWLTTVLEMDEVYDCRQVRSPAGLSEKDEGLFRDISLGLAEALQLTGLMDVEVILAPQGFRVLEIDARLPSQTPSVVYWSLGENLIARLAELFGVNPGQSPPLGGPPRSVIYEQVAVSPAGVALAGEHILADAPPLSLRSDFFGADWALTDYAPDKKSWVATLIMIDSGEAQLWAKRAEVLKRIASGCT